MLKKLLFIIVLVFLLTAAASASDQDAAVYVDGIAIPESLVERRMQSGFAGSSAMSDEEKAEARKKVLLTLITEQVCLNEAERLGTDLEKETAEETERRYKKMIGAVESYVLTSYPNLEKAELDEQVDALLKTLGESRESYRETARRYAVISALENYWLRTYPQPSEDEILAYYNELYSSQKELFDADENAFESSMLNGELVLYRPVDLKLIRKAEFLFDEETERFLRQARQLGVSNLDSQIEAQYHALADRVEPVYESLLSGKLAFGELQEQLEPGSSVKVNYFHPSSTRFGKDYYERADAFSRVGEISTAYLIPNGYAVLEFYGELPAGDVSAENAGDAIREALNREGAQDFLTMKKQELLDRAEIRFPVNEQ